MKQNKLQRLILISILAALSFILMLLQFPIPFMPPFLMVDLSDIHRVHIIGWHPRVTHHYFKDCTICAPDGE